MYIAFFCATHVALYDNIVDNLAMTWVGKNSSPLGDTSSSRRNRVSRARLRAEWLRASVRVKRVTHAREGNSFNDKVYSLFIYS